MRWLESIRVKDRFDQIYEDPRAIFAPEIGGHFGWQLHIVSHQTSLSKNHHQMSGITFDNAPRPDVGFNDGQ